MLLKSIIIFAICNYMREILNINMCKVYVNYKTLFIERRCCIFMSLAQGSCAVAAFSGRNVRIRWPNDIGGGGDKIIYYSMLWC